jgi:type VI secretion system secreted protein VgrG
VITPTQIYRPFRVKTTLGDDALLLDSFVGSERLSEPFRFVLRLLSLDPNLDLESLLETPVVLTFKVGGNKERHIHGNINRIRLLESGADGMAAYEAEIVPWFWFLTLFSDCRIFQNKSALDIVKQVFADRGLTNFVDRTTATYSPRGYCVQYRETDFNFVSRLLEEEGVFYFFEQNQQTHTLVLGDDLSAFAPCANQSAIRFLPGSVGCLDESAVVTLESEFCVKTGKVSSADYDFTKPTTGLSSSLAGAQSGEAYDYPGSFSTKDGGEHSVRIRLEEQEACVSTVRGQSTSMGFECGYKFTLTDHYRDDVNIDYTLTALDHHGRNADYRSGRSGPFEYYNDFEAIPNSVAFRPPRRARKPVIEGTQTAVVVGKSGEEIWTDQYGRIKVQFFWDRAGQCDENSSCWIRVAQGWAGKNWGFIAIPRVGHEVLVTFLEGDPDRPLVTGSVYNAEQMPPYALPDNQTQSAWKSLSSKGGGGFNEIRFEDKKGGEQVFIHAEKDMDLRIKNDRREWIGEDRHLVITRHKREKTGQDSHLDLGQDLIEKIGRDHHLTIAGKEAISIGGSHSLSVTGDVVEQFSGNYSSQITQNLYLKAMQIVIEAMVGLTIKVGESFITINPDGIAIQGLPMVQINSAGEALTGTPGAPVPPQSPAEAEEALDAEPGSVSSVTARDPVPPASMSLDSITPATPPSHYGDPN